MCYCHHGRLAGPKDDVVVAAKSPEWAHHIILVTPSQKPQLEFPRRHDYSCQDQIMRENL
jgi:hypothetical protein